MRWRIYYGDGSVYDDGAGSPFDAPSRNVQVIVTVEPAVGRLLIAQRDYYWWDDHRSTWFGGDLNGLWDNLDQRGPKRVLFGRFIPNNEYQACIKRALADPDLPPKTARHPEEIY